MLLRGRNPEFLEITRPTSNEASSFIDKVIGSIIFLRMYNSMYKTDYSISSKFSFLLQVINNRANKMRNTFFKAKMALLVEISVSFCNIETGNNNVVWFLQFFISTTCLHRF
jgi:hypothetical protein